MAMDEDLWEGVAADRAWRQAVYDDLATIEEKRAKAETTRRQKRRNKESSIQLPSSFICERCQKGLPLDDRATQPQQALHLSGLIKAHPLSYETERSHQ